MRQVQAKRFSKANPKLKIEIDAHNRPDAPFASFKFIDDTEVSFGSLDITPFVVEPVLKKSLTSNMSLSFIQPQQFFDTQQNDVKEMMFQVHLKAMQLDADYEMAGKSIDEL